MTDVLTPEQLRFTPPALADETLLAFLREHYGVEGQLKPLSGERDQNFRLTCEDGRRFVLKIASPVEDPALVDFQVQALLHIERADNTLPVPRLLRSKQGNPVETLVDDAGDAYPVRLLSYVEGVPIAHFSPPSLLAVHRIGVLQGRLCRALRGFAHPAETHFMPWDTMNGLVLSRSLRRDYLPADLAADCSAALERLEAYSLPAMDRLPAQVIHNDAHAGNVMCDPDDPDVITGVIDFGDLIKRPIIIDLSTSLTSMMERCPEPLRVAAALLSGYEEHTPIPDEQLELLFDALLARAILTVELLRFRVEHTETSQSFSDVEVPNAIAGVRKLLAIDPERFLETLLASREAAMRDEVGT